VFVNFRDEESEHLVVMRACKEYTAGVCNSVTSLPQEGANIIHLQSETAEEPSVNSYVSMGGLEEVESVTINSEEEDNDEYNDDDDDDDDDVIPYLEPVQLEVVEEKEISDLSAGGWVSTEAQELPEKPKEEELVAEEEVTLFPSDGFTVDSFEGVDNALSDALSDALEEVHDDEVGVAINQDDAAAADESEVGDVISGEVGVEHSDYAVRSSTAADCIEEEPKIDDLTEEEGAITEEEKEEAAAPPAKKKLYYF